MRENEIRFVTTGGPKPREVARKFRMDEGIQVRRGGLPQSKNSLTHLSDSARLIQVFLLHSERESAGLTLTCARYVFLGTSLATVFARQSCLTNALFCSTVEPTLSPSFELQAIGRVDRLGQTQQTTVFCYASNQTVDANIVRLSGQSSVLVQIYQPITS